MSAIAFIVLICVLVFVHEYGHFWAARRCGVKVLRFSIGFGKVLWQKTDKQGTEWAFSLIPLGGYVRMLDAETEISARDDERYANKSVWQRMFIIFAGPAANFIFAIFAYWAVFIAGVSTVKPIVGSVVPDSIAASSKLVENIEIKSVAGENVRDWEETLLALISHVGKNSVEMKGSILGEDRVQTFSLDLSQWNVEGNKENPLTALGIRPKSAVIESTIKSVMPNSAAAKAGIVAQDKILSVNGKPFEWQMLLDQVKTGQSIELTLQRDEKQFSLTLTPEKSEQEGRYLIGITPNYQPLDAKYLTEIKYDILTAFGKSLDKVFSLIKTIISFIGNLMTGELSLSNMGGPISMAKGAGATAEIGWVYYLSFMALISVNLGVMNLFPIVPLDGGQLVLLSAEAVKGKPVSAKIQAGFQRVGIAFVLGLMCFALLNDLLHL